MQSFMQNLKILKFNTENALCRYFRARIRKSHCQIWHQRPKICLIAKFGAKSLNLGPKVSNFHIFGLEFEHIIAMFQIRKPEFVLLQSLVQKQKSLNLRPKIPYFGVFGHEFGKTVLMFEISTLKFVYLQNFTKKQKYLNLGPKMPDLCISGTGIWKQDCQT